MNGKQAKKLRAAARKVTVGRPWEIHGRLSDKKTGKPVGGIILHPECGKALYRQLKKAYRRGETAGLS